LFAERRARELGSGRERETRLLAVREPERDHAGQRRTRGELAQLVVGGPRLGQVE
jgi:hypothetical protein